MRLSAEQWLAFAKLTYPHYSALLCAQPPDPSIVAAGALLAGQPIGLALARLRPGEPAEILSLFVAPSCRRRGIASQLFAELEESLRALGAPGAEAVYATPRPEAEALETILERAGWPATRARMLLARADRTLLAAPGFRHARGSSTLDIVRWCDLSETDRTAADSQPGVPEAVRPRQYEREMHLETSLALRIDGTVAGWVITHSVGPNALRYTSLYARGGARASGLGLALAVAAAHRQLRLMGPNTTGSFGVWTENARMAAFVRTRLAPFLVSLRETRGAIRQYDVLLP